MAEFEPQVADFGKINDGQRYENGDGVGAEAINSAIEASWFASYLATLQPVYQETTDGQPKVSIEYDSSHGLPYFVFYNIASKADVAQAQALIEETNQALETERENVNLVKADVAQAQADISTLYAIASESGLFAVTTIEQQYTTRQTANGENIIDGQYAKVLQIQGDTVRCENLIPYPYADTTKTEKGVTFTDNGDGSITIIGTATGYPTFELTKNLNFIAGKTYTISQNLSNADLLIAYNDGSGATKYITARNVASTFVWDATYSLISVYIQINNGTTINGILNPMLNEGSTALPYQPYFTDLKNASFNGIKSTGRNLWKYEDSYSFNGNSVSNDRLFDCNGTYTLSFNYNMSSIGNHESAFVCVLFADGQIKYGVIKDTGIDKTFELTFTGRITAITFLNWCRAVGSVWNVMLNNGATELPYEPYVEDTYQLQQTLELGEWDKLNPKTGELTRATRRITFNGTEKWYINTSSSGSIRFYYPHPKGEYATSKLGYSAGVCNLYEYKSYMWDDECVFNYANTFYVVGIPKHFNNDLDTWRAHLAELYAKGTPLVVEFEVTEDYATTETLENIPKSYKVWKNGSETVIQGETDNSKYGAENTITQEYFTLEGGK